MSFDEPPGRRAGAPRAWALALTVAWLAALGAGWLALDGREEVVAAVTVAIVALLPVGLIWLAAAMARQGARGREERARLGAEIEALRAELRASGAGRLPGGARDAAARRDRRRGDRRGPDPAPEPPRPDEAVVAAPDLAADDLVRALDFPEDAEDEAGFEALRRALADPHAHRLVQASQDVLTLLSEDGVYMDELRAEPAEPALWRRFAGGVRGPAVAAVGSVRDPSALELAGARMARDAVFRDAAQHFLRQFDLGLQRFSARASDDEIAALARTRTARAFMLLARAEGAFG